MNFQWRPSIESLLPTMVRTKLSGDLGFIVWPNANESYVFRLSMPDHYSEHSLAVWALASALNDLGQRPKKVSLKEFESIVYEWLGVKCPEIHRVLELEK